MKRTANDWLQIAKEIGYRPTENGEVISHRGVNLKLAPQSRGYLVFSVKYDGKIKAIPVHRFVAYFKYGEDLFSAECVRHLDGNPLNNSFENISLGTIKQNYHDMDEETIRGIYANRGKFTREDVNIMKEMREDGFLLKDIGEVFGISFSMAGMILRGDAYKQYGSEAVRSVDAN